MAKMEIINCIEERILNQKNYIAALKRKILKPDFDNLIQNNIWKENRDFSFSKHPRHTISSDKKEYITPIEKLYNYLNINEINTITDVNLKIIEVNKIIKKYGNLNNPKNINSYPINKIGWIESNIGIRNKSLSQNSETIYPNLYCSHWLSLQKIANTTGSTMKMINEEMIQLYGNNGMEGDSQYTQGTLSDVISCKTCGLSLQMNELDDVMKSDGKLIKMNDITIDGLVGTDPVFSGKSGYDYNAHIRRKLIDDESIAIYDLLVLKIIDKLNFNIKPKDILQIINSVKVEVNQITHKNETNKLGYRMACTGAYLLIYLQINPDIILNMNNHYKIQFLGIFGTRKIDQKDKDIKV
jgi:hypothetical protein